MIHRLAVLSLAVWLLLGSATSPPAAAGQPGGAAGSAVCTGDCDADGVVRVDELMRGIGMMLGKVSSCTDVQCAAAFCNASCGAGPACQRPRIECLLRAVRRALGGCPTDPCTADPDCDDGNPCSSDRCGASGCEHSCLCE